MKNLVFYHSRDLDGWMSAAILMYSGYDLDTTMYIGWDYGQPVPGIPRGVENIAIVDICFPMPVMEDLAKKYNVLWIDHHKSSIEEFRSYPWKEGSNIIAILPQDDELIAACELTWDHFQAKESELVTLLGAYDCFRHKDTTIEMEVLHFQYGARAKMNNPNDCYRYLLAEAQDENSGTVSSIMEIGKGIYHYLVNDTEALLKRTGKILIKDGENEWLFAIVNRDRINPSNFGINYHTRFGVDGFACWSYDHTTRNYICSLYSEVVDCSVIAKKLSGGGHKGAAGFVTKDYIFNQREIIL